VFSVVNALLLRPLPFAEPDRLVWIGNIADNGVDEWRVQPYHMRDLRDQTATFEDLAGYNAYYGTGNLKLTEDGQTERLTGVPVTCNLLPLLAIQPIAGRHFNEDECQQNGPGAVLISHGLWQRRFGGDPRVVGRNIRLNESSSTVVGVLPAYFDFGSVFDPGRRIDVLSASAISEETNRRGNNLGVIGRLKPGKTLAEARSEFQVLGRHLTETHTNRNTIRPKLASLAERVSGRFRSALFVLAAAVGAVMLIVCANLSNLQLTRMAARHKELAVRVALGASRSRLTRQLLTESVMLSLAGGVAGALLAVAGTRAIARLDAFTIPLLNTVQVDASTCAFLIILSALTGVAFGLLPALRAPAMDPHSALKDHSRGASDSRSQGMIRSALVAVEVAFACVLLLCAGLLVRSFLQVLDVELGYRPERVASLQIDRPFAIRDPAQRNAYFDDVLRRVRETTGVNRAALADTLPLGGNRSRGVAGEGQVYARDRYPEGFVRVISDGYFETMGIAIKAGREFARTDALDREMVAIVNETLARTLWPGQEALGKVIAQGGGAKRRVIGIVSDVRHKALESGFTGEMYLPIRQTNDYGAVNLLVRSDLALGQLAAAVSTSLAPVEPNLATREWRTLMDLIDKAVSPRRFLVLLLGSFGGLALVVASLGIYAVISYSVQRRQKEIGIRLALGASTERMKWQVVGETLRFVVVGLAIGLGVFWPMRTLLEGLLFGVEATDAVTLVAVPVALISVATLAGYLPARRAAALDPVTSLRAE
jgi:predicted permease